MPTGSRLRPIVPVAVIGSLFLIYASTLQTDINGHSIPPLIDVGELEVSLSSWGTVHPTGYPLWVIVGNLMANIGRLLGFQPAAATSALSLIAVTAAFIVMYIFVWRATQSIAAAIAAIIVLALCPAVWLNSVVTEVYSTSLFFTAASFYAAWRAEQGDRVPSWLVALLIGLLMAHHRTTWGLVPAFLVLLWSPAHAALAAAHRPGGRGLVRTTLPPILAFLAPFAFYAYIPLRIVQQAPFIYEEQRFGLQQHFRLSLDGIVTNQTAYEFTTYIMPITGLADLWTRCQAMVNVWATQLGVLPLAAGCLGLVIALFGKQRKLALAMWLVILCYGAFGVIYYAKDIESLVIPSYAAWVMGIGLFVGWAGAQASRLAKSHPSARSVTEWALAAILVAGPLFSLPAQRSTMYAITQDPFGRETIRATQRIPDACPTVFSLWGIDYFAYYYGKLSTRELPCLTIEPLHTDIRTNWQNGERVFTTDHFFYQTPVANLEKRFGRLYLQSAGFGSVELSEKPATAPNDAATGPATDMAGVMSLLGYDLQRSPDGKTIFLTLYWRADSAERPDYSVFVHVSDQDAISGPDDIVSQSDSLHPVYGWYPTSRWSQGEVVRDDYAVTDDPARPAKMIQVGLYQNQGGTFTNLGSKDIVVQGQ
jgi:hypothetical protein